MTALRRWLAARRRDRNDLWRVRNGWAVRRGAWVRDGHR